MILVLNLKGDKLQKIAFCFLLSNFFLRGCKKYVEIHPPVTSVTSAQVFSTDAQANSAMAGIYTKMAQDNGYSMTGVIGNGATTIFCGLSADELVYYGGSDATDYWQFYTNNQMSNNLTALNDFWAPTYFYIYQANSVIEGLAKSTGVDDSARNALTGEAKFIRAFWYFYLTNLFGDVPLALTPDFNQTATMSRTAKDQIFKQIVQDLKDAQTLLAGDFSAGMGERIRPNKWAATALLARVYIYTEQWKDAESQATDIINNSSQYGLEYDLANVFNKNSRETIWQLQLNASVTNATKEGLSLIPAYVDLQGYPPSVWNNPFSISYLIPSYYLSSQLLSSFEPSDLRMGAWVGNTSSTTGLVNGVTYYYPYKYTIGQEMAGINRPITQYYMMLRFAEQYLIRAEAEAQQGKVGAIIDLNIIRNRAGLPDYSGATDKISLLNAIMHERRVEFFAEWGQRWLDLKRTNIASSVLSLIKTGWIDEDQLYPIPLSELQTNPNLTQNAGY